MTGIGQRGPARKPTATKRAQGNPGGKPLPKERTPPPADGGIVLPPDWAVATWEDGDEAKRMWDHFHALLTPMGLLTTADADSLATMCETYAEYVAARLDVRKVGATYTRTTDRGAEYLAANPSTAIASDAWRRLYAMLQQFGLSPASRSKVPLPGDEKEDDPFSQFDGDKIAGGKRA